MPGLVQSGRRRRQGFHKGEDRFDIVEGEDDFGDESRSLFIPFGAHLLDADQCRMRRQDVEFRIAAFPVGKPFHADEGRGRFNAAIWVDVANDMASRAMGGGQLAAALDMGGGSAGADEATREALYEFGLHVGLAFQLQDDYLDAFGNPENFGKQVGGDILADKKTFLLIRALDKAQGADLDALQAELGQKRDGKVGRVLDLYRHLGVDAELRDAMAGQVALAEGALARMKSARPDSLAGSEAALALLHGVAEMVTARLN